MDNIIFIFQYQIVKELHLVVTYGPTISSILQVEFSFHEQGRDNRFLSAEIVIGTNENETYSREDCKLSGWPELVIKNSD